MPEQLSPQAQKTIQEYFNLPFANVPGVRCPYFNNAKLGQRGQLRVLIGKGAPAEIAEEAVIISHQYSRGVFHKNGLGDVHGDHPAEHEQTECVRQFLTDNNLGVDCSGFVANVLRTHFKETKKIDLAKKIFIAPKIKFWRWLISRLRPLEQISVAVLADEKNSTVVADLATVRAADLIIMLKTGPSKNHNHVLLVTANDGQKITYVHARAWSSEGKYGHGVSEGFIAITNPNQGLLEQAWEEKGKTNQDNETYLQAKQTSVLQVRRIDLHDNVT